MGNRLSKIVTRTGDAGTTGLGDGTRVPKDSLRIETIGQVDELNSTIGVLLTEEIPDEIRNALTGVQHDLFGRLEALVERFNDDLPPLKDFILPGGSRAAALAHLARTVCRRAERHVVSLANGEGVSDGARKYLNRLSDLLFVLGRALNRAAGCGDVLWVQGKNRAVD